MTVRLVPGTKKHRTTLIEGFLTRNHVAYELLSAEQCAGKTFHLGTDPTLEVDGRLFVDPNEDALRKIFRVK